MKGLHFVAVSSRNPAEAGCSCGWTNSVATLKPRLKPDRLLPWGIESKGFPAFRCCGKRIPSIHPSGEKQKATPLPWIDATRARRVQPHEGGLQAYALEPVAGGLQNGIQWLVSVELWMAEFDIPSISQNDMRHHGVETITVCWYLRGIS